MLRKIIIKCNVIVVIALGLLCLGTVSHAYIPEITTEAGRTSTADSVKYSSSIIRDGITITYEDLATKKYYECIEYGVFLVSKYSPSRPEKDATIEINGAQRYIQELTETNKELGKTRGDAYSSSPYGPEGSTFQTVYTPGKFTSSGSKESRPSQAFIDLHSNLYEKSTGNYPNEVQSAVWIDLERVNGQGTTIDDLNASIDSAAKGRSLAKAGEILEKTMSEFSQFKSSNSGNTAINETDYSNLKIGFNKNKNTILVGPFKLNYVWSMYKPKGEVISDLLNENGTFEFSVIKDLKVYADDALSKEIGNYKLIYPNRTDQDRIQISNDSDIIYRYPLPGEEFYIEFSNADYSDVDALSRLKVTTGNMTVEGTHQELTGTSEIINYDSKVEPVVCNSTRPIRNTNQCALHPEHQIGDGHARAYIYSVEGSVIDEISVQKVKFIESAKAENNINYVTMELGQPATFFPFIFPIPIGYYRDNEHEYVPCLPVDPDPNDPPTPPDPDPDPDPDPEIKLTFDIAGTVWVDDFLGKETLANGVKDEVEKGLQNIIVKLYKVGETEPVRETLTNENGEYMFQYVRIGYDYYVEFTYDGMTYTTTKYLGSDITSYGIGDVTSINEAYRQNPDNYKDNSHAVEALTDRLAFNSKFMEISYNQAVGTAGVLPLSYRTYMAEQGAISALITTDNNYVVADQFKMTASTKTTGLYYLLDDNYVVSTDDMDLTQIGEDYYYHGTYPGTLHINLGLVKREKADFAVKNDVYQTIVTMKENIQTYRYNDKTTNSSTYDPYTRVDGYYTDNIYTQEIDSADYNWRYDSTYGEYADLVKNAVSEKDELNVYIEYKYLIRNQSSSILQFGSVLELANHFDSNLEYSTSYDFTNMTSWIETNMVDENGEVYREEITWDVGSTKDGYTTMTTTGIKDKVLQSGETIEIHVILKVKKDANRNIIMDLGENDYKENVLEITKYTFNEGKIDRDSNPGNVVLGTTETYEDDTDSAPFMKLVFNDYAENNGQGKVISGHVWEDLASVIMENNLYTGNGVIDASEQGIPNVKVELIEVLMDKATGNELEILKKVGDTYSYRTDKNGEYKFTNLPTGTYKVKFTYGDETQLKSDVTFNGQDYKSVSTDTLTQQYQKPSMEVMILADTSESMTQNGRDKLVSESVKDLIESLYDNVQTIKVGATLFSEPTASGSSICTLTAKPDKNNVLTLFDNIKPNTGTSLEAAIENSLTQYTNTATTKVMVICTDGYISSDAAQALNKAAEAGIKVISVVCSTDEWTVNTFGTETNPTAGTLYYIRDVNIPEYITEVALEDILQEVSKVLPNATDAKDVQKTYNTSVDSEVGEIYTRQNNIDYTTSMTYSNGSVVDGKDTTNISEFAKNTQMTAITPIKNVMIQHNNQDTSDTNLGLIERPKVELQIREDIARIEVKLSNGETIIDTAKDLTQNVQIIPNARYNIFLDDEIMQGATLTVKYRITVFNNGHVDTLGEYFDYDMYNTAEVAKYTATMATRVGTIYSYYTNLTFRAEDNSNWAIEKNQVSTDAKTNGTYLTNWQSYIKNGEVNTTNVKEVKVVNATDGQPEVLSKTAMWEAKALVKTGVEDDSRIKDGTVKVVQTNSLNDVSLYPVISKEALNDKGVSSVSTYVQFSKTISTNDVTDTLNYKQSVEIVERLNDLGRRDYIGVPGNYSPHSDITEYDSAKVADVVILNPFGENMQTYFGLAIGLVAILGVGVIFIKRKILK